MRFCQHLLLDVRSIRPDGCILRHYTILLNLLCGGPPSIRCRACQPYHVPASSSSCSFCHSERLLHYRTRGARTHPLPYRTTPLPPQRWWPAFTTAYTLRFTPACCFYLILRTFAFHLQYEPTRYLPPHAAFTRAASVILHFAAHTRTAAYATPRSPHRACLFHPPSSYLWEVPHTHLRRQHATRAPSPPQPHPPPHSPPAYTWVPIQPVWTPPLPSLPASVIMPGRQHPSPGPHPHHVPHLGGFMPTPSHHLGWDTAWTTCRYTAPATLLRQRRCTDSCLLWPPRYRPACPATSFTRFLPRPPPYTN